jgi:hypothetical protein
LSFTGRTKEGKQHLILAIEAGIPGAKETYQEIHGKVPSKKKNPTGPK